MLAHNSLHLHTNFKTLQKKKTTIAICKPRSSSLNMFSFRSQTFSYEQMTSTDRIQAATVGQNLQQSSQSEVLNSRRGLGGTGHKCSHGLLQCVHVSCCHLLNSSFCCHSLGPGPGNHLGEDFTRNPASWGDGRNEVCHHGTGR